MLHVEKVYMLRRNCVIYINSMNMCILSVTVMMCLRTCIHVLCESLLRSDVDAVATASHNDQLLKFAYAVSFVFKTRRPLFDGRTAVPT